MIRLNELKKDYFIEKILNMHHAQYYPKDKILILYGPIKVEYLIKLKRHIFMNRIEINDILVK